MRKKPSNENINSQKSVKNINNRRKMHQNRKKLEKKVKNSCNGHKDGPNIRNACDGIFREKTVY